jgi:hypothetical protein
MAPLIRALGWDSKTENPDVLKKSAAEFFYNFNQTSTFLRGQAAIADWILKALFNLFGYSFSWPQEWDGKTSAMPDQQALTFSKEEFIEMVVRKSTVSRVD